MRKSGSFLFGIVAVVCLWWTASPVLGQTFPGQPIQFVIPMTPGDMTDLTGRALATELAKVLSAQVVPINKPGGGASIGADFVANSKKDGHTILYANSNAYYAHAMDPAAVACNPLVDLEPLCMAVSLPIVIVTRADAPWKSSQEFVEYMRQNPGKVRVSTTGMGGVGHFNHEILRLETATQSGMIPYKGGSPAMTALLGGHVEASVLSTGLVLPHIKAGKLRAVFISQKHPDFPGTPTLKELGYKKDIVSVRNAFYAPLGLEEPVKKILISALEKSIKSEEVVRVVGQLSSLVDYKPASEFKELASEEYAMVQKLLKGSQK